MAFAAPEAVTSSFMVLGCRGAKVLVRGASCVLLVPSARGTRTFARLAPLHLRYAAFVILFERMQRVQTRTRLLAPFTTARTV